MAPTVTANLTVREATDGDLPAVLDLLQASLGWVPDDDYARFFAWKHHESPFGRSPAWVAVDPGAGDRVVGFRTFSRWRFDRGGETVPAVRAVDTATHPDYQGRGIFSLLTRHALEALRDEGVAFVFNTPNDKSRPGYLKMGWQLVERLPVAATVRSPGSLVRLARARTPADKWSAPSSAGVPVAEVLADAGAVEALLAAARPDPAHDQRLRTARTPEFLAWRYGFAPLHYRAVVAPGGVADGVVVFRVRRRGAALEAAVCEQIVPVGDDRTAPCAGAAGAARDSGRPRRADRQGPAGPGAAARPRPGPHARVARRDRDRHAARRPVGAGAGRHRAVLMADTDHTTSFDPPTGPDPARGGRAAGDGGNGGPPLDPGTGPGDGGPPRFTRRRVLTLVGAGGLVGAGLLANRWIDDSPVAERRPAGPGTTGPPEAAPSTEPVPAGPPPIARWSDPATWGGQVPGPGDVAGISQPVLLDVDAEVAGVQIAEGGELVFDPTASRTLSSAGNILVAGRAARPARRCLDRAPRRVPQRRRVEASSVATRWRPSTATPACGSPATACSTWSAPPKKAWTSLAGGASAGDSTITVADASGWRPGDEIVVTPTVPTTTEGFAEMQDRRVVEAVDGATVTLDGPLEFDHPAVTVREGVTHMAEVLNLTRNVTVEGTPEGRAHVIMLDIKAPQAISHVGLRHLGPQGPYTGDEGEQGVQGIEGRYGLHFHMSYDATRGSVVDGVVAYDGGNHSFVPHLSHGITFRDCVAHDQSESAFWWDPSVGDEEGDAVPTNDLVYDRCVASHIKTTDATEYDDRRAS